MLYPRAHIDTGVWFQYLRSAIYLFEIYYMCQIAVNRTQHTKFGSIRLISADSFLIENPSEISISYWHNRPWVWKRHSPSYVIICMFVLISIRDCFRHIYSGQSVWLKSNNLFPLSAYASLSPSVARRTCLPCCAHIVGMPNCTAVIIGQYK